MLRLIQEWNVQITLRKIKNSLAAAEFLRRPKIPCVFLSAYSIFVLNL